MVAALFRILRLIPVPVSAFPTLFLRSFPRAVYSARIVPAIICTMKYRLYMCPLPAAYRAIWIITLVCCDIDVYFSLTYPPTAIVIIIMSIIIPAVKSATVCCYLTFAACSACKSRHRLNADTAYQYQHNYCCY